MTAPALSHPPDLPSPVTLNVSLGRPTTRWVGTVLDDFGPIDSRPSRPQWAQNHAAMTTSNASPGIDFNWLSSASFQRGSVAPEMNQFDPLSATIMP